VTGHSNGRLSTAEQRIIERKARELWSSSKRGRRELIAAIAELQDAGQDTTATEITRRLGIQDYSSVSARMARLRRVTDNPAATSDRQVRRVT
jgi:hypothetical protein